MSGTLVEWDAAAYDGLPLPHVGWGAQVVDRLRLTGHEAVLDLGAGTGRDTLLLLDRLPAGRVLAVDGSAQMLERLRERTAAVAGRVEVLQADLREPLPFQDVADAAMSVATLHWIPDHRPFFASVLRALKPGGRFVAEGGGHGNLDAFLAAVRTVADPGDDVWDFAGEQDTRAALERAGFTDVEVRLQPDPVEFARGEQLEAFIATVLLVPQVQALPPAERRPFVHAVAQAMPTPVVDYVRLQLTATKPA